MSHDHPTPQPPASARTRAPLALIDATGIVVCVLLTIAFYFISVAPLRESRAARQALWDELQPRLDKVAALEHQSTMQQRTLASVGEQIATGQLQLRSVDQINQRIADLTAAAGAHGLQLEEVKPGTPTAMQWFMTVPVKLSGSGEYPHVGDFLHNLPSAFPDVAVVGFNLTGEPEALDKTPRFELNLVWYAAPRLAGK